MNEDELQEYIGKRIDIMDVRAVRDALETVWKNAGIPTVLVHSAAWALAYGTNAEGMRKALEGGVTMAATRFRVGDDITPELYRETAAMAPRAASVDFCREMKALLGDRICCIPCKDLSHVEHPTVVGLGDSFAGGLLPGLLKENRS
jgi:ADP-dependent phosphofructokinase/glucokinase